MFTDALLSPFTRGATTVDSQPTPTTSTSSNHDPLLAIMPKFVFSMPAQVIVDGINLSLVAVLSVQLLFTAQYHFPFSRKNYCLQLASVTMLMINVAVHLNSLLDRLHRQSHQWPYMFAYIGVQIPPQDGTWSVAQQALYLLMRAISIALVHLTHIQFLTLLFPSALEARLILWMLGPLALVASGMEFTALASENDYKTSDLGDSIRNICNSALFMLYTSALLIWGVFVNRRRAWRTDGGTAAFGGGAVGLAIITTTISFIEIAYDRLWWLPDLCWTLTIWQSWLGFWWWVGSGMGIGEVEDRVERQDRKVRKEEKLRRRQERENRHRQKALLSVGGAGAAVAAASGTLSEHSDAMLGGMRRLKDRLRGDPKDGQSVLSRRNRRRVQEGEAIEMDQLDGREEEIGLTSVAVEGEVARQGDEAHDTAASSSDTQPTTSGAATSTHGWMQSMSDYLSAHQPKFIERRIRRLRQAHVAAAEKAATEQSARREQVLNRNSTPQAPGLRTMINNRTPAIATPNLDNTNTDTIDSSLESMSSERHIAIPLSPREQLSSSESIGVQRTLSLAAQHDDDWVDDETEARAGSDQEDVDTPSRGTPSWSWRGGLQSLRMRDSTRYD